MFDFNPFDPTNESELFDLIPEGEYDFSVINAKTHTNTKNGNRSIKITIQVFDKNGMAKNIDCYLTPNYKKLFAHFFSCVGLEDACKKGSITPEQCIGKSGICIIGVETPAEGSTYDPKNNIVDFIKTAKTKASPDNTFDTDTIPF